MMINLIKPSFQKYVVYYDKIFANQLTEMLSFLKVKPLPGAKKQFPNVSSRVKSISDRKVLSSKSIPMDLTPDIRKVDDSAGIFPNRFGYVPTAVSGTSLQQKSLVCSSLIPLDFKSKIPVRKIFRTASKPDVKLNQAKVVTAVRKSDSRSKDVELRKPFRASPVPSSTYKYNPPRHQYRRSQLPVTENVVTKTHEDVKQKLIIATPAPSPRTVHQQPIRPVDANISAYDDQKPEPIEITEQMIVDKIPTSVTEDTISHLTSLPIDLNTDEDVLTTDGPSSVSSEVSPPQSTDELETDEPLPMIEIQPLGVEPNSVDPPINAAVITGSTITELETSPETSPDDGPADVLLPGFTSCDFRYKGQSHVPGYTVIPNQPTSPAQLEDKRQLTPELNSIALDISPLPVKPSVELERPFDNFRIQQEVVKIEGLYMDVLSNIPASHFGRILGKNLQNVTMLRKTYGVKISVTRQVNAGDSIEVFITSGLPADRHKVADYIVEEVIPVQIDVNFGVGFLTKSKKIMARQRYRYVAIDEIDRQGHCILRGRLADCRNLFDDFKYGRY